MDFLIAVYFIFVFAGLNRSYWPDFYFLLFIPSRFLHFFHSLNAQIDQFRGQKIFLRTTFVKPQNDSSITRIPTKDMMKKLNYTMF